MATETQIASLRRMIDDVDAPTSYSDTDLNARIDEAGSTEQAASVIWREKAASYSTLVDVSESGSSRKLSDLRKAAMEQAAYYDGIVSAAAVVAASRPRTRPIVRPSAS